MCLLFTIGIPKQDVDMSYILPKYGKFYIWKVLVMINLILFNSNNRDRKTIFFSGITTRILNLKLEIVDVYVKYYLFERTHFACRTLCIYVNINHVKSTCQMCHKTSVVPAFQILNVRFKFLCSFSSGSSADKSISIKIKQMSFYLNLC